MDHFRGNLGSLWDHFGIILESFWDHFGIILGSFWHLAIFWDYSGITSGSFWDQFGIILAFGILAFDHFVFFGDLHAAGIWGTPPPPPSPPPPPPRYRSPIYRCWNLTALRVTDDFVYSDRISESECNTKTVLHSESMILNVIPNGITFRISDSECNTITVLHSKWHHIECNSKMELHSESLILNVIPKWHYIQNH